MSEGATGRHLKGREVIMKTFDVSKETVSQWRRAGAPIIVVGRKLQADYEKLWAWIIMWKLRG
jgi:hypothetical protein